jgi:hypothetical protein
MNADLLPIVAALAELTDDELRAVVATANEGRQIAPGIGDLVRFDVRTFHDAAKAGSASKDAS